MTEPNVTVIPEVPIERLQGLLKGSLAYLAFFALGVALIALWKSEQSRREMSGVLDTYVKRLGDPVTGQNVNGTRQWIPYTPEPVHTPASAATEETATVTNPVTETD